MKRNFWTRQFPLLLAVSALVITAAAWQGPQGKSRQVATDTIPGRDKKVRNIDDALDEVEKGRKEIERTLENKQWEKEMRDALDKVHFDAEKLKQDLAEQLKSIDVQKMQLDIQKAMKEVDFEKMRTELQKELEKVDTKEMKEQLQKAMKEIDLEKMKSDMNASISKIDVQKIKEEMEKLKEFNMKEVEENLKKIKPEIEKSMQDAKQSLEKAKTELVGYKNFIGELDRDGLIDKNKNYTIEYKKGELTINGKKQAGEIVKKYSFLKDHKDFRIDKDEDKFNINND